MRAPTRFGAVIATFTTLLAIYAWVLHPWLARWGATHEEQVTALPGDALRPGPNTYTTRAITIHAPPEKVWPWLLQMGQDRGGFYSNDWLENLIGLDMHDAQVVRPEWQHRELGDVVRLVPDRWLGGLAGSLISGRKGAPVGPRIWLLEKDRAIADSPARFVLLPAESQTTRLLLRESIASNRPGGGVAGEVVGWLIWDPMHFVMEQRMLRGIQERVEERPAVPGLLLAAAYAGWVIAAVAVLAALATRRHWFRLGLAIAAMLPALLSGHDLRAAVAAFVAVGITVAASRVLGERWAQKYALIGAAVLLVLLLAPDPHAAFGLIFAGIAIGWSLIGRRREVVPASPSAGSRALQT